MPSKQRAVTTRMDGLLTCDTCGWYHGRWENGAFAHYCCHPRNTSPVMGASKGAYDARKVDGCCGPSGDLHTSKYPAIINVIRVS